MTVTGSRKPSPPPFSRISHRSPPPLILGRLPVEAAEHGAQAFLGSDIVSFRRVDQFPVLKIQYRSRTRRRLPGRARPGGWSPSREVPVDDREDLFPNRGKAPEGFVEQEKRGVPHHRPPEDQHLPFPPERIPAGNAPSPQGRERGRTRSPVLPLPPVSKVSPDVEVLPDGHPESDAGAVGHVVHPRPPARGRAGVMSSPCQVILPEETGTSPATAFRKVVFPDPFEPKIATISPGRASRVTPAALPCRTTPRRSCLQVHRGPDLSFSRPPSWKARADTRQVRPPLPVDPAVLDRHDAVAHGRKEERVVGDQEKGDPVILVEGTQEGGELASSWEESAEKTSSSRMSRPARDRTGELEPAETPLGKLGSRPEPLGEQSRPAEDRIDLRLEQGTCLPPPRVPHRSATRIDSATVRAGYGPGIWNVLASPARNLASIGSRVISFPPKRSCPGRGDQPERMFASTVFPAPLGPNSPTTSASPPKG